MSPVVTPAALLLLGGVQAAEPALLRPSRAEATSYLRNDWNRFTENYHPSYAFDDNPATAWVEGVAGTGEGEFLTAPLSPLQGLTAVTLRVRNGYQKSPALLRANAAPKDVTVSLLSRGAVVHEAPATLAHTEGWQDVTLSLPAPVRADALRLQVDSTHPGKTYADTCISDIQILVVAATQHDASAEAKKLARLAGWAEQRKADARFFANQPPTYPWASSQFVYDHATKPLTEDEHAGLEARFAEAAKARDALMDSPWHQLTQTRALQPMPEGLWTLFSLHRLVDPTDRSFFETDAAQARKSSTEDEYGGTEKVLSNHKLARRPDGTLEVVAFSVKTTDHDRFTTVTRERWLVRFDRQERMASAVLHATSNDELGPNETQAVWTFSRDTHGKINRLEQARKHRYGTEDEETGELVPLGAVEWMRDGWKAQD